MELSTTPVLDSTNDSTVSKSTAEESTGNLQVDAVTKTISDAPNDQDTPVTRSRDVFVAEPTVEQEQDILDKLLRDYVAENQTLLQDDTDDDDDDPHCFNCEARAPTGGSASFELKSCSRCKLVTYCSRQCQTAHWKAGHKLLCM